ncbi:MAG: hypothetical protein SGCHY_000042 [Lobulomycetales sp.]
MALSEASSTPSHSSEDDDHELARLIALFPGVDIGLLSNALERSQGDFEQAVSIVREGIPASAQRTSRKARPTSSAARRRDASRQTAMDEQHQDEDDALMRQLQQEELEASTRVTGRPETSRKEASSSNYHNEVFFPDQDANVVEVMTREAINEAALRGQLRSEDSEDEDSDADDHIRHHSPESERLSSRQASSPDVPIADTTIQQLFSYTSEYQPEAIELFPELKCFVPDYIPAIGDIDPMIKIPAPPSSVKDDAKGPIDPELGLVVLDEPATKQSDPAVLDLQLRAASKGLGSNNKAVANEQAVRSITLGSGAQGQVGQKALNQWVQNVYDLHVHKPPDRVEYSKRMPDIEKLMQEWPPSIDVALSTNSIKLPGADIDLELPDYVKVVCNILDIPVNAHSGVRKGGSKANSHSHIEALHVLFTLYTEFKNSQHFRDAVARKIVSSQVVVTCEATVKELVENALDAKATSVDLKIVGGGLESISCSDTGSEISHADALIACQRYTTSKIQTFSDLEYAPDPLYTSQEQSKFIWVSGSSFFISPSFRGEALNSICNASGSLVIQTRTAEEKCEFFLDNATGYNDYLHKVRRQQAQKRIAATNKKCIELLKEYSLANPETRLSVKILPSRDTMTVFPSCKNSLAAAKAVYPKLAPYLVQVDLIVCVPANEEVDPQGDKLDNASKQKQKSEKPYRGIKPPKKVHCFVNKRPLSSNDKFFKDVSKAIANAVPEGVSEFLVVLLQFPGDEIDVNIVPDKSCV